MFSCVNPSQPLSRAWCTFVHDLFRWFTSNLTAWLSQMVLDPLPRRIPSAAMCGGGPTGTSPFKTRHCQQIFTDLSTTRPTCPSSATTPLIHLPAEVWHTNTIVVLYSLSSWYRGSTHFRCLVKSPCLQGPINDCPTRGIKFAWLLLLLNLIQRS